jgi:hypothetical protein
VLKLSLAYVQTFYYKSSHLFFPTRLLICDLLLMEWVTMGKPDINSVEVHAQHSHNRHYPADGVLVVWVHSGRLSLWVLSLVVRGSHAYTLRIDWNLWCHVMKFKISLVVHRYAMIGIFDVMLWSLRYHLGRTLLPHTGVTTLWTFWQDCQEGSSLSSSVLHLLHMEIATFVVFVTLVNRRILKSWN